MLGQIAAGNQLMEIQNGGSDSYSHTQVAGLAYSQTNDGNATVIVLDNVANGSQLELMGYTRYCLQIPTPHNPYGTQHT